LIGKGGQPGTGDFFPGEISECRVYDVILTSDKIQTIFNNENDPGEFGSPGFYTVSEIERL